MSKPRNVRIRREIRILPPSACTHSSWVPAPMAPNLYEMCFNCRIKRRLSTPQPATMHRLAEGQPRDTPHEQTDKPIQSSLFD